MELQTDCKRDVAAEDNLLQPNCSSPDQPTEIQKVSFNEAMVPMTCDELSPHVRIVKPSRPSLTYDRVE